MVRYYMISMIRYSLSFKMISYDEVGHHYIIRHTLHETRPEMKKIHLKLTLMSSCDIASPGNIVNIPLDHAICHPLIIIYFIKIIIIIIIIIIPPESGTRRFTACVLRHFPPDQLIMIMMTTILISRRMIMMMTTMLMIGIMVTTILSIWHIDKQEEDHGQC